MTEVAWANIAPLLPARRRRGGQWRDHRWVINGRVVEAAHRGTLARRAERYGPWQTCADQLLYRWRRDDTWDRILAHAQTRSDTVGAVVWEISVDSSSARAYQHASGRGRPRKRPDRLMADKGYSCPRCRRLLRQRQIPHTIPERRDQQARRSARPARPLAFEKAICARCNMVARGLNRLKQWHGLATRYEKRAVNYRAMVVIAAIDWWCES